MFHSLFIYLFILFIIFLFPATHAGENANLAATLSESPARIRRA